MTAMLRIGLAGLLFIAGAWGQEYGISTFAGGGTHNDDGVPATSAALLWPSRIAVDSLGNLYIAELFRNRVRRISADGIITTVAGTGTARGGWGGGYSGDGGPATDAQLNSPWGMAADTSGNLYIADSFNLLIRKVSASGIITTVAGTGVFQNGFPVNGPGYSGDDGPATDAQLSPNDVAVDSSGNLYIAGGNRVRKVSANGIITTVAGTGESGYSGDDGPATSARLSGPGTVAVDGSGNLYIGSISYPNLTTLGYAGVVRKVSANGIITKVWEPRTGWPPGVAVDGSDNLYIADDFNHRVLKVSADGMITTVAGSGSPGNSGDGGPAASAQFKGPWGIAVESSGQKIYVWDSDRVRLLQALPPAVGANDQNGKLH